MEETVAQQLRKLGIPVLYETQTIRYEKPASQHRYTPDFTLPNGIIIETKGIFDAEDRKKHLLIREQRPDLDIRFVFSNAKAKIYKGSKTTYADWCDKHDFLYNHKTIPKEWIDEETIS